MRTAAVLLAADASPEGEAAPPPALWPWDDGRTLVEHQVASLLAAGVDVVAVVLGCGAEAVVPLLGTDAIEAVSHDRWRSPAATLRAGAAALPRETAAAIIVDVREPRPPTLYRQLLRAYDAAAAAATRPLCRGIAGTPVIVDAAVLAAARNAADDNDPLGGVLRRLGVAPHGVEVGGETALLRVASAADCARVRRLIEAG